MLSLESVVDVNVYTKVLEDRIKVSIIINIFHLCALRCPIRSIGCQFIVRILEVGRFVPPAFGEGPQFVYRNINPKDYREYLYRISFKLKSFSAS